MLHTAGKQTERSRHRETIMVEFWECCVITEKRLTVNDKLYNIPSKYLKGVRTREHSSLSHRAGHTLPLTY